LLSLEVVWWKDVPQGIYIYFLLSQSLGRELSVNEPTLNENYILTSIRTLMALLEGRLLFTAITALTCLGFLLIGYDNGLMGG